MGKVKSEKVEVKGQAEQTEKGGEAFKGRNYSQDCYGILTGNWIGYRRVIDHKKRNSCGKSVT